MPQPDYKDYNNYSQRDKESMRTAAADESVSQEKLLVTQTDEVEGKLTAINTDTTAIKTDVGKIKTDVAAIKTAEQTIQSRVDGIPQDLGMIISLLEQLVAASYKIEANPSSLEVTSSGDYSVGLSYTGEWSNDYRWEAYANHPDVSIEGFSSSHSPNTELTIRCMSSNIDTYITIAVYDNMATRPVKEIQYHVVGQLNP